MVRHVDVRHLRGAPGGAKWKLPAKGALEPTYPAPSSKAPSSSFENDKKLYLICSNKLLLTLPDITTVTVKSPLLY